MAGEEGRTSKGRPSLIIGVEGRKARRWPLVIGEGGARKSTSNTGGAHGFRTWIWRGTYGGSGSGSGRARAQTLEGQMLETSNGGGTWEKHEREK